MVNAVKALVDSVKAAVDSVKAQYHFLDHLFDAVKAFVGGHGRKLLCGRISSTSILP
jgi:hypothetical protein